jgi:hypothetical protein
MDARVNLRVERESTDAAGEDSLLRSGHLWRASIRPSDPLGAGGFWLAVMPLPVGGVPVSSVAPELTPNGDGALCGPNGDTQDVRIEEVPTTAAGALDRGGDVDMRRVLKPALGAAFVLSPHGSAIERRTARTELSAGMLRHSPDTIVTEHEALGPMEEAVRLGRSRHLADPRHFGSAAPTQDAGLVENCGLGSHG